MEWMTMPLKRYADFEGRSRRKEYWMFALGVFLLELPFIILLGIQAAMMENGGGSLGLFYLIIGLFCLLMLALFIPSLAVAIRRLHDQDKSGWYVLLGFIPYVGGIILLVLMCLKGTVGANRFGPDPLEGGY